MKLVINRCFGGFSLSDEAVEILHLRNSHSFVCRDSTELINLIEEKGSEFCSGFCANLAVIEIPDEATDYYINEYDGREEVIYVVDGKLHFSRDY